MCMDCIECKEAFDKAGVRYEFIDINSDLKRFKEFLKLRDNSQIFDICKKEGFIEIPAIVDGSISIDPERFLKDYGKEGVEVL